MADYDFSNLNDKEFELLVADILSFYFKTRVERFKAGRDQGVDGRFFCVSQTEAIVQCKHWLKSGLPKLLTALRTTEALKVNRLAPARYIFVTSLPLSRQNKKEIKSIFTPYILRENDIFGNEDLNDILSKAPMIEQNHYKLWITSTNVLTILLNSAIVGRSKYKLEEIQENSNRYVITTNHTKAKAKLETLHSIIITGAPGIGKTFLADQLCQEYITNGYELCFIENSLNEAEQYYNEERQQLFYFDDFLGRNFLIALGQHQDSQIISFIKRIKRDPKKRFILTSRSTVLNQCKSLSDLFKIKSIDQNEYEVTLSEMTELDKAKILYNHIWFSQLTAPQIEELYIDKRYKKIIAHENFNPRLIEFITDAHRLTLSYNINYWQHIQRTLSNPQDIWHSVFANQIDRINTHIVIAVVLHGKSLTETELKECYYQLKTQFGNNSDTSTFEATMRVLVGALLNRNINDHHSVTYDLFNPSIADYVLGVHLDNLAYVTDILVCLNTAQSIVNIRHLYESNKIDKNYCLSLIDRLFVMVQSTHLPQNLDDFCLELFKFAESFDFKLSTSAVNYLFNFVEHLLNSERMTSSSGRCNLIFWSIRLNIISPTDTRVVWLLNHWLEEGFLYDDVLLFAKTLMQIEPNGGELTENFEAHFIEYYCEVVTEDIIGGDAVPSIYEEDNEAYRLIREYMQEDLIEFPIKFDSTYLETLSENCDITAIIEANIEAASDFTRAYTDPNIKSSEATPYDKDIDDLFERD